jgi:hypothetical protein
VEQKTVMSTDENNQDAGAANSANNAEATVEKVSLSKSEYEELLETRASFGSLKREFKDLKKSLETKETSQTKNTAPDISLLQKSFLRSAGITDQEEVELALSTAKKWGVEVDALVDDNDFKIKLEKVRTNKSNALAASNVNGGSGSSQAKNTAEYWIAKGAPPSADQVPDRKVRAQIARAMISNAKNSKKFYNE